MSTKNEWEGALRPLRIARILGEIAVLLALVVVVLAFLAA